MNRNRPFISGVTSDVLNREKNLLVTANTLGKIFSGKTESNLQFNNMINAGLFRFNDTSAGGPIEVTSGYLLVQTVNPDYNSAQEVKIRQLVYDDGSNDLYTRVGTAVRVGYSITWTPWTRIGGSDLYNRYVILHEDTYGSAGYYYRAFNSYVLTLPEPDDCAEGDHICLEQNESLGIVIHLRMADFPTNCPAGRRYMYDPNSQLLFHAEEISIRGNTRYRWDMVEEDQTVLYNEYKNNSQFYVGNGYWSKAKIEYLQPEIIVNEKSSKRFVAYIAKNVELEKYWLIEADNDTSAMVKSLIAFITETNNTSKRLILRTRSELIAADAEDRAYADAQDLVYDEINKERFKKIFKGINQNGVDFNTLVTGQFLRFDETSSNGPVDVKSGYALIFSINYEESEETGLRVRQIVYSDDNPGIYTREGTADTQFVMPTWSEWTLYGDTRSFSLHTRLTDSIVGVPGTYYRSSETCVITLPPAYRFPVGSSIGLEQSVDVGIIIDNNDEPTIGTKMFDPIANLLFEFQSVEGSVQGRWEVIESITDPATIANYTANTSFKIRNRKIEYVMPYAIEGNDIPRKCIMRITEDAYGAKYWAADADDDIAPVIKSLVSFITETGNSCKRQIMTTQKELVAADAEDRAYADAQDVVYDDLAKERMKKIFKGVNQHGVNFNSLVTGQFLRFDDTHSNGPTGVTSGYALIFSINYEDSEETELKVRQMVYPDDNAGIYTREGFAVSASSAPTWTEWTLYGDPRSFSMHTKLTTSVLGDPGTFYRSHETCVVTLPPPYMYPVGSCIGLEQSVNVGIVIDNNDDPTTSVGSKMFDPISNILFEYQSDEKWETIEDVTDPDVVAQYRANANYSIRNRKIEYVAPYTVNSEEVPRRFVARVTENAAGSKYWAIDADEDCSDAIKGLVEHINEKYQDLISYVNKHGSRYSYFRNLTIDGLVGRTLTLYKSAQPAVLTLPTISEEKEGRWIGLMQFMNKGYVVNSESVTSSVDQKIWDNHVKALFQQTTSNKLWRMIDPLDTDFPSDIVDNHDGTYTVPSSYLNANFKVIEVDATSDAARIEFTVAVKPDNSKCWVTEGSKSLVTF